MQRENPVLPGRDGSCPRWASALGEALLAAFAERQHDPMPWGRPAKVQGGVTCHNRPRTDSRVLEFRTAATFCGVRADIVFDALMYENRMSWDPALASVAYLRRYKAGEADLDIVTYTSQPAAHGIISARAFLDLRCTMRATVPAASAAPATQLVSYSSASSGKQWAEGLEAAVADEISAAHYLELVRRGGYVRGFNLVGGGLRVDERIDAESGERFVDVVAISASEIGGRLPVGIVNSATAGAMCALFNALGTALTKQHPGCRMAAKPPPPTV